MLGTDLPSPVCSCGPLHPSWLRSGLLEGTVAPRHARVGRRIGAQSRKGGWARDTDVAGVATRLRNAAVKRRRLRSNPPVAGDLVCEVPVRASNG